VDGARLEAAWSGFFVSGNDHAAIIRAALDYYQRVHPHGPRGATAGDALTALDALLARLAALYRIADEADAALAGSGETGGRDE
jgi:hypothetical protein